MLSFASYHGIVKDDFLLKVISVFISFFFFFFFFFFPKVKKDINLIFLQNVHRKCSHVLRGNYVEVR